ncbi:ABC transporter substrate-binding protein [Paracoccus hibiscisoli]|uniref:ABC transporter substrate-binding protein n=1 Tax=Paracoccus hibiscisoli TaxID=2023261 RepID=UPI0026C33649
MSERLRLGYLPLTDAAPLIVAHELGFAAEEGLDLALIRAGSWAQARDLLGTGAVDAAHMLVPMPIAQTLGLGPDYPAFDLLMILSQGGQAIAVSRQVEARLRDLGHPFDFQHAVTARDALEAAHPGPLRVGVPFPFSTQAELVRHWLEGTALAHRLTIRTVPPPQMADALAAGEVDAFCVGEPWASVAVERGVGALLLAGRAIWAAPPEKGLVMTRAFADTRPDPSGFIGSANIDTSSRLCMASSVAGHRHAFGGATMPGLYEDLEQADLVVLTGSNLAWCHPVLHSACWPPRPRVPTCASSSSTPAAPRPARGPICIWPSRRGRMHICSTFFCATCSTRAGWMQAFCPMSRLDAALTAARGARPQETGLPPADLAAFLEMWAGTDRVVTVYSQGINQSDSGTDKVNAILNCHLAAGRIGRPGSGPFSVTGQPNAMGGREVGGLSTTLACHLELENPAHRDAVRAFWNAPRMADRPGLKAVDMFRAVEYGHIKALWIIHTNPAVTMPDADRVARAIAACDFVAVSEAWPDTDTARLADVLLPSTAWGEKDGTVTNSERRISRQRAALPAPGQARADWWQIAQVATRMGFAGFDWAGPAQIFAEHAALSGVAGALGGDFDISDLAGADYATMQPVLWPQGPAQRGGRFFGTGRFHTPDGRARMVPVAAALPAPGAMLLNTGRTRDQWHTMTRTGLSPRLSRHLAEPYLEIHPRDAARLSLATADLAQVRGQGGQAVLRVLVSDRVRPGHPFAPIHWSGQNASGGRIDALVAPVTDPVSGQPASKSAPVSVTRLEARWHGFLVSDAPVAPDCAYWARARLPGGWQVEMAGTTAPPDWQDWAMRLLGLGAPAQTMIDRAQGLARMAFVRDGRLAAALFVAPGPVRLSRSHVGSLLGADPRGCLGGWPAAGMPDVGPEVCACLGVGRNTILRAVAGGCRTVGAIGAAVGAGTSCGSCRPALSALLAEAEAPRPVMAAAQPVPG